jgi:hypothetical protein
MLIGCRGWGRRYLISLARFSFYMISFGITRSLVSILCTTSLFRRSAELPPCGRKGVPSTSRGSYERRWDFGITEILFGILTSKLVFGGPHAPGARLGILGCSAGAVTEAWEVTPLPPSHAFLDSNSLLSFTSLCIFCYGKHCVLFLM